MEYQWLLISQSLIVCEMRLNSEITEKWFVNDLASKLIGAKSALAIRFLEFTFSRFDESESKLKVTSQKTEKTQRERANSMRESESEGSHFTDVFVGSSLLL